MGQSATSKPAGGSTRSKNRLILWVGVVFIPVVFAWFTLTKNAGFTTRARVLSFGWMVVWLAAALGHSPSTTGTASTNTTASAPAKPQDHATAVAEARAYWKALNDATKTCVDTGKYVTKSIAANDVQTLYENGKAAQNNCLITAEDIDKVALPEHAPDNVRTALTEARKQMSEAYTMKSENYGTVANIANNGMGNAKPSDMVDLRQSTAAGEYRQLMAIAKIADAFKLEGVSMVEYSGLVAPTSHHRRHH